MSADDNVTVSPEGYAACRTGRSLVTQPGRVACIGLGRMGSRIAWRLADSGLPLAVYDADQSAMDRFRATGVRRSRSPEAVVVDCPIVLTILPNGRIAREVLRAAAPAAGTLVIDASSAGPAEAEALAARLADRGVALVDVAFAGGIEPGALGWKLALAGGHSGDVERARPILERLAGTLVHGGPVGSGIALAALDSLLAAVNFAATIEVLQTGRRFGLELGPMLDVFNRSIGASHATRAAVPPQVLTGRFAAGLGLDQLLREVTAALAMAQATKTDIPLCRLAGELWRMAEAGLEPGADYTALAKWYEHRSGTRLRS